MRCGDTTKTKLNNKELHKELQAHLANLIAHNINLELVISHEALKDHTEDEYEKYIMEEAFDRAMEELLTDISKELNLNRNEVTSDALDALFLIGE